MKYLGIDYGSKRIGLATGDSEFKLATPLKTVLNDINLWKHIKEVIYEESIEEIILGRPVSLKNQKNKIGDTEKDVLRFVDELKTNTGLDVKTEDERFSTHLAHRLLGNIKKDQDAVAASIILQSYLDRV